MQSLCWTSRLILHPQIAQAQRDAPSDTYSKENPPHDSYQMTNLYVTFLNSMVSAGMSGPFMQYTHVGNCWGLSADERSFPSTMVGPSMRPCRRSNRLSRITRHTALCFIS